MPVIDEGVALAIADPVEWMSQHFWVRAPLDPITGALLPPGPIRLLPFQRALLRAALEWDTERGGFRWQTIVWSTPKKTGKTTIAAAVTLWYAFLFPGSEIILLANDGRQATDRVFDAVKSSLELHSIGNATILKNEIYLANGTRIFPMPVDAAGASGANPALTVFTELWGYTSAQKRQLWAELTPPPTIPNALRWVESYAGFIKGGSVLEVQLYEKCRLSRSRLKVPGAEDHLVMVNPDGRIFYYYDHGPQAMHRFGWQTDDYFKAQQETLSPSDFERFHLNEWVGRGGDLLAPEWFANCLVDDAELEKVASKPIVVGIDVGFKHASYAVVGVTHYDSSRYIVTDVISFIPGSSPVDLVGAFDAIVSLCRRKRVIEVSYDPYQFESDAQRLRRDFIAFALPFSQRTRGVADSSLRSAFQAGLIMIPRKFEHLFYSQYCSTIFDTERKHFTTSGRSRIDLMVALSMALARARYYAIE